MAASAALIEKSSLHAEAIEEPTSTNYNEKETKKISGENAKCELVHFDSLPEYLKGNPFILNHYRCEWPLKQTILSIFSVHNETLNIWTHLIGFFIFFALTITTVRMADDTVNLSLFKHAAVATPVARWPFYAFLLGATFCLLTSSACHLLMCHSERCCDNMLHLDYTGITILIVASFYPTVYYGFLCDPFFIYLYLGSITLFGLVTVSLSFSPASSKPGFQPVRTLLFVCMGLSGLVPLLHKLVLYGDEPETVVMARYEMVMGVFYLAGVGVYAGKVPERWMPGKFDVVGHSHQLFHVLVVAGAYTHYLGVLDYFKWRDREGCY